MSPEKHLRRVDIERVAAGERLALPHLNACEQCAVEIDRLRAEARAFAARRPAAHFIDALPRRKMHWYLPAFASVCASALVLLTYLPQPQVEQPRLKGSGLSLFVTRAEATRPLESGERPKPRDRLTMVYDAPFDGHLLIIDAEQGKPLSALFPFGGSSSRPISAGRTVLADGFELDTTAASEWAVAIFSESELDLSAFELQWPSGGSPADITCGRCRIDVIELTRATP